MTTETSAQKNSESAILKGTVSYLGELSADNVIWPHQLQAKIDLHWVFQIKNLECLWVFYSAKPLFSAVFLANSYTTGFYGRCSQHL